MKPIVQSFRRPVGLGITLMILCTPMLCHAGGKVAAWGDNYYGQCILPNGLKNVKAIAGGGTHSLALKANGTVVAWGRNLEGQTNVPSGLSSVIAISAGGQHSLALKADGTVVAWGYAYYGVTNVPAGLPRVTAIAAGSLHSLALKADGTVAVWGSYPDSTSSNTNPPAGFSNVIAVAAGSIHSVALRGDGTVVAWGNNNYGQTNVPAGLSNVVAVAAGSYHNLALKADGTVVTWGYGFDGSQTNVPAGLSDIVAIAAGQYQSLALKADGSLVTWGSEGYGVSNLPPGISNVTAIACGGGYSLALVSEGPPEIIEQPGNLGVPYQSNIVLSVTATGAEPLSCRWFLDGYKLYDSERISGVNRATLTISNAQFADAGKYTVIVSNAFGLVQSTGAVLTVISAPIVTVQPVGRTVIAGTNISLSAAAMGTPYLSYQWLRDGEPIAGARSYYLSLMNVQPSQSGSYSLVVSNAYGSVESSNALVIVLDSPPYILTQPTNRSATVGGSAIFAVVARGSTPLRYQWRHDGQDIPGATNSTLTLGPLRYDQAGYYTVAISNAFDVIVSAKAYLSVSQVTVWGGLPASGLTNYPPGLTNVIAVSAGEAYVLALKRDGTVLAWGAAYSDYWRLPGIPSFSPTNVPSGLSHVVAISAGSSHALALKSDGTVVAWGNNSYGQTNVPAGLSNVVGIAAGQIHSLALKSDGRVVAWGSIGPISRYPWYPVPKVPYTNAYSSLTNVPSGLSNVTAVAAGRRHNLALKNDGTVVTWGSVYTNNITASLSNIIAIACGKGSDYDLISDDFNLALRADGSVVSWGAGVRSSLQQLTVMPGVSNAVAIAASTARLALRADGRVVSWGNPSPVTGLSNVIAIAAGGPPTLTVGGFWGGPPPFFVAATGDGSPFFTLQPASHIAMRGTTIRLQARAVSVQPLSYQWQFNDTNIPGATNGTLVLSNVQGRDTGNYRARVANPLGTVISATAQLTIPFSANLAASLNATNLVWVSTNAPWFAQIQETHDGDVAAQSGHITHGQQSVLQTTVIGPGTLTFWWKVSSEEGYDRLWFSMDFLNWAAWISGETDWRQFTYHVQAGSHVLRWAYTKDSTVSAGQDAGWLDEVAFTPTPTNQPSSIRFIGQPIRQLDGTIELTVNSGQPSEDVARCEVQVSTNLLNWDLLPGALTLTNGALYIRDTAASNNPVRFYRVIER